MEELYQTYRDDGFIVVTLITENYDAETPSQDNLEEWAEEYGLTSPVLADGDEVAERYSERGELSLPSMTLIGPGAEVLIADGDVEESDIEDALP